MTTYERPALYLRRLREQYPDVWIHVEGMRRDRGKRLPSWPEWCYLPLSGAYAIASGGGDDRLPLERMPDVGVIGALAAWRATQGIYEYDDAVLDALWSTPVEGSIPVEILQHLPDWCVYVLTPGREFGGMPLYGYFAHLEWDAGTTRQELRLALDVDRLGSEQLVIPLPLHMGHGGIAESLAAAGREAERQAAAFGVDLSSEINAIRSLGAADALAPLISVLLYLCSEGAEIHERAIEGAGREHPRRPPKARPQAPTTWAVAHRLGAALRLAESSTAAETGENTEGTHARPRAHIRRAHWHTYRVGAGRSGHALRWLHPILVNVDLGQIVPTIRRVD